MITLSSLQKQCEFVRCKFWILLFRECGQSLLQDTLQRGFVRLFIAWFDIHRQRPFLERVSLFLGDSLGAGLDGNREHFWYLIVRVGSLLIDIANIMAIRKILLDVMLLVLKTVWLNLSVAGSRVLVGIGSRLFVFMHHVHNCLGRKTLIGVELLQLIDHGIEYVDVDLEIALDRQLMTDLEKCFDTLALGVHPQLAVFNSL